MILKRPIFVFLNLFVITNAGAFPVHELSSPAEVTTFCHATEKDGGPYISFDNLNSSKVAEVLGWSKDSCDSTLCRGHYIDPDNIVQTPFPPAMKDVPMNITASKTAYFTQHGTSVVIGDVKLVQPGREITADCVTFYRDQNIKKISSGIVVGHVSFREYGKLAFADTGHLDFIKDIFTFEHGLYRLLANTPSGITNIWGRAKHAVRDAAGVLKMKQATYTACPPNAVSWHIWSNRLTLNRTTGRGVATNAFIFANKIPVFYIPYLDFPIDKKRKTGFLYPSMSFIEESGFGLTVPYYLNLAPNYDATITPTFYAKRGLLLSGIFRYLTQSNEGIVNVSYIPYDRVFTDFRNDAATYTNASAHARSVLQNSSPSRGFLSVQDRLRLNEHWNGSLNVNYVTDDYFLQNFGSVGTDINRDQLFNQAEVNYASDHWYFTGRVQGFQTLHPIGRGVADQYRKLPQLVLTGNFPDGWKGLNYNFNSEITNFTKRDNFENFQPAVGGSRFNVMPDVSLPLNWMGGYVIPRIQVQATGYSVHNQPNNQSNNIVRVLPLISVDSGMVFSKNINFSQQSYSQTLEPRLFYLFVPEKNQNDIPVFDTVLPTLDFSQLFRANRFSGVDRVGDANQLTAALTTRLLDDYGRERLNASLGQIFAMRKHHILIGGGVDPLVNEYFSPLVGQAQYFVTPEFNVKANAAWDPNYHRFNNAIINLQYNKQAEKVLNFWYNYSIQGVNPLFPQTVVADLSLIGGSVGWRLLQHWNVVGSVEYKFNSSQHRVQDYLYGLEYDSCCWAIRIVRSGTFVNGEKENYENRMYLQFVLKGLGSRDILGSLEGVLPGKISGYSDKRIIGL